jgi:hypothetical protein
VTLNYPLRNGTAYPKLQEKERIVCKKSKPATSAHRRRREGGEAPSIKTADWLGLI